MSELKKHTASGQALGYYFQLERALSWIAKSPWGSSVGIETEDDVVIELTSGAKIYEQDKSSTSSIFPFSTNKIDFWKTLLIWLNGLKSKEIQCVEPHPTFYMVTNKIASNQLAVEIGRAESDQEINNVIIKLREAANNTPEGIKDTVTKVIEFNNSQLSYLIKNIKFYDGSSSINKMNLASDLQLPKDDEDFYIERLIGYVFNIAVEAWRNNKPAIIERDDFMRLKNTLISDRFKDTFNEETVRVADIVIDNERQNGKSTYIKQLELIELNDDEIRLAIEDFLKSSKARTIMAKKGYIEEQSLVNTNNELTRRWTTISRQKKRTQLTYKWTDIDLGQEIYDSTLGYKATINGYPTRNYFLTNGIYHLLANDLKVGWHPNFEKLLKNKKDE